MVNMGWMRKTGHDFGRKWPVFKRMEGFYLAIDNCNIHYCCLVADGVFKLNKKPYTGTCDVCLIGWGNKYLPICIHNLHKIENWQKWVEKRFHEKCECD